MRSTKHYMIVIIALFSLNACAPQDSATADDTDMQTNTETAQPAPATPAPAPAPAFVAGPVSIPVICQTCGTVRSITAVNQQGEHSGAGAVIGAIVGGVAGNQVGGGSGRSIATAVGAVGGALIGRSVEQNRNATFYYEVVIDMEGGGQQIINVPDTAGLSTGMNVSVVNGNITIR